MSDTHSDPLDEVRSARRWALVGTFGAAFALIPVYAIILGLSIESILVVLGPAAVVALAGVELTSRWEYGMHRRYAYPHHLGCELAAIREFGPASERSAELICQWLKARAVVVGWLSEDGQSIEPVAAHGLPSGWLAGAPAMANDVPAMNKLAQDGQLLMKSSAGNDEWFGEQFRGDRLIYVPLVRGDRLGGVVAIASRPRNAHVRDQQLLAALGVVMGLALDNCRLYGGQRAHAQHLQELNRMKSDFLSTVSHELRTPLTSIMMAAEMLLEEEETRDPDSVRGKLVRNIVRGASRLGSLVTDLVNVSREDEFQPRLELDLGPVTDVIGNSVGIIQPLVAAKHQTIEVQLGDSEVPVRLDRLRFEQVLINLLSNAQRYTPPGGHIAVLSRIDKDEMVISVTDSGPGVAPEDQEYIFEPFYRGDRSGLGLGLAIAKSLVELHNGRIWVESANSQGSTFSVALPIPAASRTRRVPVESVRLT